NMNGGSSTDYMIGDLIVGGRGHDNAKLGEDAMLGGEGRDLMFGDSVEEVETLKDGRDAIRGGNGNDTVDCQNGADIAFTGGGTDTMINCELVNPSSTV
ncbi:MAG TPA: hypothetical protein VHK86_04800, partial [Nitrososphaera sp.]|nr:hypothetical protein [Nitrososphaera sp.]